MNKVILLLSALIQLSSCSFHSSQYDSLKKLVNKQDNSLKPAKNWVAYWVDQKIDLYAINFEDQIIFADENINIFYRDKQVYKITGILPDSSTLEIESNDVSLLFLSDGKKIGVDSCEVGFLVERDEKSEKYMRSCIEKKSGKNYENQVVFNSEGLIIGMQFKVHPDYPLLQLSMK